MLSGIIPCRLVLLTGLFALAAPATAPAVMDLDGALVHPLRHTENARAAVLLFIAPDCPISNRYAPAIMQLAAEFAEKGLNFWLVYADDQIDAAAIRAHRHDFNLDLPVAIDRQFDLARKARAEVTPEAAVFLFESGQPDPELVYLGRIDDQYQGFGQYRPTATHHDLRALLLRIAAGEVPSFTRTKAVGCYIPLPQ